MAGKNPYLAVTAFVEPIQAALMCFVAGGKVTVDSRETGRPGVLTFNGGRPTALNGPGRPRVTCSMGYEIVETDDNEAKPFKVHTVKYIYRLLDRKEAPIVDYHWHPDDQPDIPFPHLHARQYGCKLHHPTGRVLIEDLLDLAARECGASPRNKPKWDRILARNRANFGLGATWGTSHPRDL